MEHLKCNLFCIVKHLSGNSNVVAATSLTLILPLDSTRLDWGRLGLEGTQETQWKYLKLAARSSRSHGAYNQYAPMSRCLDGVWAALWHRTQPPFSPATCHIYTNSLVCVPAISAFAFACSSSSWWPFLLWLGTRPQQQQATSMPLLLVLLFTYKI